MEGKNKLHPLEKFIIKKPFNLADAKTPFGKLPEGLEASLRLNPPKIEKLPYKLSEELKNSESKNPPKIENMEDMSKVGFVEGGTYDPNKKDELQRLETAKAVLKAANIMFKVTRSPHGYLTLWKKK